MNIFIFLQVAHALYDDDDMVFIILSIGATRALTHIHQHRVNAILALNRYVDYQMGDHILLEI